MPYDENGNRADLVFYYQSVVARLNTGGIVEGYCGASIRDISRVITDKYNGRLISEEWNNIHQETWDYIVEFYKAAFFKDYEWATNPSMTNELRIEHINSIIEDTMRVVFPIDSPNNNINIVSDIGRVKEPVYGNIYFTDFLKRKVKLKYKGLINVCQIIILEKTKLEPMSVSSAVRQVHGLPAGSNKNTRNSRPSKVHALRNLSETEVRFFAAVWGGELIAQYMALTNDPEAHKRLVNAILVATNSVNLEDVESDISQTRALKLIVDVFHSYGLSIESN